jgi:hypothetical protein
MKRYKHILLRLMLAIMLAASAMVTAMAQTTVYTGQSTILSVVPVPGDSYIWELYNNVNGLNLAVVPGNCPAQSAVFDGGVNTGPVVSVTWLEPGTYYYKVIANRGGCTSNLKLGRIVVEAQQLPTAVIAQPDPICKGDSTELTITLTGSAPWSFKLSDGTNIAIYTNISASPYEVHVNPDVTTTYQVIEVTDTSGTNTTPSQPVQLMVKPRPVSSQIYQY